MRRTQRHPVVGTHKAKQLPRATALLELASTHKYDLRIGRGAWACDGLGTGEGMGEDVFLPSARDLKIITF